jgi:transposase-like protein
MSPWKRTAKGLRPTDARNQAICAALREGRTYASIAAEFGIHFSRVSQIRAYAGIERRRQPRKARVKDQEPRA